MGLRWRQSCEEHHSLVLGLSLQRRLGWVSTQQGAWQQWGCPPGLMAEPNTAQCLLHSAQKCLCVLPNPRVRVPAWCAAVSLLSPLQPVLCSWKDVTSVVLAWCEADTSASCSCQTSSDHASRRAGRERRARLPSGRNLQFALPAAKWLLILLTC